MLVVFVCQVYHWTNNKFYQNSTADKAGGKEVILNKFVRFEENSHDNSGLRKRVPVLRGNIYHVDAAQEYIAGVWGYTE